MRGRLHRRLFWWFGATIVLTGLVVAGVVGLLSSGETSWRREWQRGQEFANERFALVWHDKGQRKELAESVARAFELDVTLRDAGGRELLVIGERCDSGRIALAVKKEGVVVGHVAGCRRRDSHPHGWVALAGMAAACLTLWGATLVLARRLSRPLNDLVRVTREIGSGKLSSRVRLGRHHGGEVGVLAEAVNDMAVRIERQMGDQRELLAAVSHEIRSPLARLRVLVELAQDRGTDASTLSKIEREIIEMDALVGKLLASSRLEFEALEFQELLASDLASRALERASLAPELLRDEAPGTRLQGDATLLQRALGNLLENATRHGGSVEALSIRQTEHGVVFEVTDSGPGFADDALKKAFDPFYRRGTAAPAENNGSADEHGSLGLGLSLVARIARAHRGKAWAENRPEGGARVLVEIPLLQNSTAP